MDSRIQNQDKTTTPTNKLMSSHKIKRLKNMNNRNPSFSVHPNEGLFVDIW